jgi:hypothetical protein
MARAGEEAVAAEEAATAIHRMSMDEFSRGRRFYFRDYLTNPVVACVVISRGCKLTR